MTSLNIRIEGGEITSFDQTTGRGEIQLETNDVVPFHSADFKSGRPTRFPQNGEYVEVVFCRDVLFSVRSVKGN